MLANLLQLYFKVTAILNIYYGGIISTIHVLLLINIF